MIWYQLFGISVAVIAHTIPLTVPANLHGGMPKAMYFLGTIERKSFFVERPTTPRNWTEAKQFCEESNLRLATVTSARQEDFLLDAMNNTGASIWNWSAGRDSRRLSQFSWDHIPNSNVSSSKKFQWLTEDNQNCLVIRTNYTDGFVYQQRLCSEKHGTLCESTS